MKSQIKAKLQLEAPAYFSTFDNEMVNSRLRFQISGMNDSFSFIYMYKNDAQVSELGVQKSWMVQTPVKQDFNFLFQQATLLRFDEYDTIGI